MKGLIILTIFILSVFAQVDKTITINFPYAFPEGIEYHPQFGIIFASGAGLGIYNISNEATGEVTKIANLSEPSSIMPILGIQVFGDLLLGALNNTAPGLIVFNLTDRSYWTTECEPSTEGILFNDVTYYEGYAYLTESFGGSIYIIDMETQGCELFLEAIEEFMPNGSLAGINGIDVNPVNATLIVGTSGPYGKLYTIDIETKEFAAIKNVSEVFAIDGIYRDGEKLLVVNNNASKVHQLSSNDSWVSAQIDRSIDIDCTGLATVAKADDGYIVSCLNGLTPPFKIFRFWGSTPATTEAPTTGAATTGAATTGAATTGAATTGSATTGSATTGSATTEAATTGASTNGTATNGTATNGTATNGTKTTGPTTGGATTAKASTTTSNAFIVCVSALLMLVALF